MMGWSVYCASRIAISDHRLAGYDSAYAEVERSPFGSVVIRFMLTMRSVFS